MASQHLQVVTPPSKDAILNYLLEIIRAYNARQPPEMVHARAGFGECALDAEMPLLLNHRPGAPLPCREPAADFEAVNAHFSAQVHAFFNALHDLEDMAAKQSPDELPLIRVDEGLQPVIRVANQLFEPDLDCLHRAFHTRRLTIQNLDSLPLLHLVTQLRIFPAETYVANPIYMRPVSMRMPLELATRLPQLRRLDCGWLWERLPIPFTSKALRIICGVWAGPWRDDRAEFARGVRYAIPMLPSSLTKARLWFWRPKSWGDEMDQAEQMPDLVGASLSSSSTNEFRDKDPVSLGLRDLGSRLEELDICALITPDLFPSSSRDALQWLYMRHLYVEFHPCAPDGRWYFSGPRGEDPYPTGFAITREEHYPPGQGDDNETHQLMDDEEDKYWADAVDIYDLRLPDMFRICPIAERINPLLLAFALSLQKMPSLQDAELFTWLTWRPSKVRALEYEGNDKIPPTSYIDQLVMFRWGVRYEAPAVGGDGKGKVTWQVGEDWRPEDEVIRAFENLVGKDNMEWEAFEFRGEREQDLDDYV